MDMPHQPGEPHTIHMYGGTGGPGGEGSGQGHGGHGGVGQGPTVNFNYSDKEEEQKKITDWLSPINFFLRQAEISRERAKGTGGWLLVDPVFKKWESSSGSTLWCRGIPGAGKTVLVSMVVDHLSAAHRNNKDIGVACIYLNHKEADQQSLPKLLAGLWRQLVVEKDISPIAESLYKQHRKRGTAPSLEELVSLLQSSIRDFSRVFVIIDALDEYPEDQRFILLKYLAEQMGLSLHVNLMITSRPHISLEPFIFPDLETLDIQATPEDIRGYINAQISSSRLSHHVKDLPTLQEEIHAKIIGAVDGMFLLAKLHIESLKMKNTIKAVRKALTELPKNLYEGYNIAMERIEAQNEEDRETARSALIWVANAKRPLSVEELQVALAVEPGTQQLDKENLLKIEIILGVCAGLVIVDKVASVVRLVHYTTQEYLDKIQAQKFPDAKTEITLTLLTFLAFDGYPDSSWDLKNLPPLAEYSQYCLAHAAGQPEVRLRESLLMFLGQAFQWRKAMNHWNYKWNSVPWNYSDWPSQPSALWIAAATNLVETTKLLLEGTHLLQHSKDPEIIVASYYGHMEIVRMLLEKGADVNAASGVYWNSLQAAAARGHPEIVHILLEKGADINATGGKYGSSLQAAAAGGHTEIVSILLESGANVNAAGDLHKSSLYLAAVKGHTDIVSILLENGADVNGAGREYGRSLQAAAAKGYTEIVCILLENGADVNAADREYGSSLQAAAAEGHTKIVCILLEKGATINAESGNYGGPLCAAAARGHTEIFSILLAKGGEVNAANGNYGSSLQAAAARGHTEIVNILLEKCADILGAGRYYGRALEAAADGGHTEIVNILLEKGADVNAAGGVYGSSLQAAAGRGHTEIVHILIEKGADINAVGGEYGSSLQLAASGGFTDIVHILLENGADVNAASGVYWNSLQAAAARGHTDIVRILLENGADVNITGGSMRSALWAAVAQGHTDIVPILLENGANVNAAGGYEGSVLRAAAARGHTDIVCILLEKGANVNIAGGEYRSSLHVAAAGGHTEIVGILLEKGAKANATGGEYGSSLLAAAAKGYTEVVDMLLEMGARFPIPAGSTKILATQLVNMWKNSGNDQQ